MSQIINKLRDVDPNNSDAIKEALSPFFQQLSKHSETNCGQWLRTLENAINRFPKYCMSQRGNIELYLAHFLDCTNYYIVIEAAKCAHSLQQVRPTQEKTATAKSSWRDQMNVLCDTAHSILGAMFPNAVDIYQQTGKTLKDQNASNSPLTSALSQLSSTMDKAHSKVYNKQALLCTRLRNVFVFIQAMLVEIYPVAKPIRPQTILDVIVRSLSMSSGNTGHNAPDIATLKTQALRTIDALIACLGPNLIPFSPLIFRFVMQTLKWCSDNPSEQSNKVRCSAYETLGTWLGTLRSHRAATERGKCWEDELTEHIIADITPRTHTVQLTMSNQPTKNLSKKAKRKLANSMMMESNISSHMPGEKNKMAATQEQDEAVMLAALQCAETFFTVCGVFLELNTYKRFQERLVRSSYSIQEYPPSITLAILRALEALRKAAPPSARTHAHHAQRVYSDIRSPHVEITNFCARALHDIRMQLHCAPPTLSYAVEEEKETREEIKTRKQDKKKVSDRNRATLEELLGPDKVPKHAGKEVVITVNDEPSNKRRKVEETDKISLSSESGSIEISDDSDVEYNNKRNVEVVLEVVNDEKTTDDDDIVPVDEESDNDTVIIHEELNTVEVEAIADNSWNRSAQLIGAVVGNDISEDRVDSTQPDKEISIYEAATQLPPVITSNTQLPLNITNDDEEAPLSLEVAYDYPSTGKKKVAAVLEKLDGDNLPSTNDTDDVQITCGQIVKNSQETDVDAKKIDVDVKNIEVKINGIGDSDEKPLQNGDVTESNVASKDLNVEDMMADFVDEVNEDTQVTQTQTTQAYNISEC